MKRFNKSDRERLQKYWNSMNKNMKSTGFIQFVKTFFRKKEWVYPELSSIENIKSTFQTFATYMEIPYLPFILLLPRYSLKNKE